MEKSELYTRCEQVWNQLKVQAVQHTENHDGGESQPRQTSGPTHIGFHPQSDRQVMTLHEHPSEPSSTHFTIRVAGRGTINVYADPNRRRVVSGATPARIEAFLDSLAKSL